jgi:predicted kinase
MSHEQIDIDGWSTVDNKTKKSNGRKNEIRPHPSWASSLPMVEPIPPTPDNSSYEPFLLLLMGLPGSGKSTFGSLLETTMPYKFVRINQDQLKTRKKCEAKLRGVLRMGGNGGSDNHTQALCPIIDRCNFNAQQRSTWYGIAAEYAANHGRPLPVDVVVLDVPQTECLRRCTAREHHETISSAPQARGAIEFMVKQWQLPAPKEQKHYRSLTIVRNSDEWLDLLVKVLNQKG